MLEDVEVGSTRDDGVSIIGESFENVLVVSIEEETTFCNDRTVQSHREFEGVSQQPGTVEMRDCEYRLRSGSLGELTR